MTKCEKCSAIVHERTSFCPNCGFDRNLPHRAKVCPICNRAYPRFKKHCSDDGSVLVEPEALVPKCVECGRSYSEAVMRCPRDGGDVIAEAYRDTKLPENKNSVRPSGASAIPAIQKNKGANSTEKRGIDCKDKYDLPETDDFECDIYGNTYDEEDFTEKDDTCAQQENTPEKKKTGGGFKWIVAFFMTLWIGPIGGLIALAYPAIRQLAHNRPRKK